MTQENGPIHAEYIIMRNVMAYTTYSELGGLFKNFQKATSIKTYLPEMDYPEPPISAATDNSAAHKIVTETEIKKYSEQYI